jgi:hypothetical protein
MFLSLDPTLDAKKRIFLSDAASDAVWRLILADPGQDAIAAMDRIARVALGISIAEEEEEK